MRPTSWRSARSSRPTTIASDPTVAWGLYVGQAGGYDRTTMRSPERTTSTSHCCTDRARFATARAGPLNEPPERKRRGGDQDVDSQSRLIREVQIRQRREGDGWVNWSGLATLLADVGQALTRSLACLLLGGWFP